MKEFPETAAATTPDTESAGASAVCPAEDTPVDTPESDTVKATSLKLRISNPLWATVRLAGLQVRSGEMSKDDISIALLSNA